MESKLGNFRKGFSHKFKGQIWKLLLHEDSGLMAVETRHAESRNVTFSVIDIPQEKINFLDLRLEQTWNLKLFHLTEKYLLLNSFKHAESPEAQGLICLSSYTGELTWEQYNISPDLATDKGIRVFDTKIFPRKYYWIDYFGKVINQPDGHSSQSSLLFPAEKQNNRIPSGIKKGILIGPIYSIIHGKHHIFSFHETIDKRLHQRIVVTQGDSILLDDIIISDIQKLQPEAFFIQNETLYYIRSKRELMSYFL